VVECIDLKPCWVGLFGRVDRNVRMSFSRTLLAGHSSDMGL